MSILLRLDLGDLDECFSGFVLRNQFVRVDGKQVNGHRVGGVFPVLVDDETVRLREKMGDANRGQIVLLHVSLDPEKCKTLYKITL